MTVGQLCLTLLAQTVIQIGVLTLAPLLWWGISGGSGGTRGFMTWIGLFTPSQANFRKVARLLILVSAGTLSVVIATVLFGYSGRAADMDGFTLATYIISVSFFALQSGVGEEILFRGLIAKRFIARLGYRYGNTAQAIIFALIHVSMGGSVVDRVVRVINAFILGYAFGHVMEKECGGSIVPGAIAHVAYNFTASVILAAIYMAVSPVRA